MRVLAGDIGGTKVLLQTADVADGRYEVLNEIRYDSAAYGDFSDMLAEYLAATAAAEIDRPQVACFGVAGPVRGDEARTTNLPWILKTDALENQAGLHKVRLINDFQAVGYGIETLGTDDVVTLQEGEDRPFGLRAVIGAGTGLGHGMVGWEGTHFEVYPSEGGHVDFGPTDMLQVELLQYLMERFEHVSYERVVCGRGLVNIYNFLRDTGKATESPAVSAAAASGDAAAVISQAALDEGDELASLALDTFVKIYGAQAGNLAITCLARGGVYVAGGIAPKIIDKLAEGPFVRAFCNKGQMRSVVEAIPIRVIVNPKVGLQGAAVAASRLG